MAITCGRGDGLPIGSTPAISPSASVSTSALCDYHEYHHDHEGIMMTTCEEEELSAKMESAVKLHDGGGGHQQHGIMIKKDKNGEDSCSFMVDDEEECCFDAHVDDDDDKAMADAMVGLSLKMKRSSLHDDDHQDHQEGEDHDRFLDWMRPRSRIMKKKRSTRRRRITGRGRAGLVWVCI